MNLEKYLYESEKNKIYKLSKIQASIVERREAIRLAIGGKIISKQKKKNVRVEPYVDAYKKFLKDEGFFDNKELEQIQYNKKSIDNNEKKGEYKKLIFEIYTFNNGVLTDLRGGIANIHIIDDILKKLKIINGELNQLTFETGSEMVFRFNLLNTNISKLINLFNESKGDIVDYYTNKGEILNLLNTINNSTKNLLK